MLVCALVWNTGVIQKHCVADSFPFRMTLPVNVKLRGIQELVKERYLWEMDEAAMQTEIYKSILWSLEDDYAIYYTEEEAQASKKERSGAMVGIGVSVRRDDSDSGHFLVKEVMPGRAAERAGILAEDVITKVNGISTSDMTGDELLAALGGETEKAVELEVYRSSDDQLHTFHLVTEEIVIISATGRMLSDGMGYIQMTSFNENTYDQFMEQLHRLQEQEMQGLILDLRFNLGGRLNAATAIGDELLPEGLMIYTETKKGQRQEWICDDAYLDLPLVILVNNQSASASEILAGAAQVMGAATLVGEQTYGKGIVQSMTPLSDGSAISFTTSRYYLPDGSSIHSVGITPDYIVEQPNGEKLTGIPAPQDDVQLQEGMRILAEKMRNG